MRTFLGLLLFLTGVMLIANDVWGFYTTGVIELTLIGDLWFDYSAGTLNLLQAGLERHVWPPLWDPVMTTLLLWPASLVALFVGALIGGVKAP